MMILGLLSDHRAYRSLSPRMHNTVMRRRGLEGIYLPFAVAPERLGEAAAGIRGLGIAGVNVTVPHKEAVAALLDGLAEEAELLGAVNTVVRRGDRLEGYNTDVAGFQEALSAAPGFERNLAGRNALVVGAGGAAKAVAVGLHRLGFRTVWLANRSPNRAEQAARIVGAETIPLERAREVAASADLLVNTTSVSLPAEGAELARIVEGFHPACCRLVVDINYGRTNGIWQQLAAAYDLPFVDGIPMLVHQAALSFRLWTGEPVTADEYFQALDGKA
jgi:shikimate dehydrogenase